MVSKLKEARQELGYSIEEISEILKIRKQYIIDIEEEVFNNIPGQVYIDGYTRMYCEFLGVESPERNTVPTNKSRILKVKNNIDKKFIIMISSAMLILSILLYILVKSYSYSEGSLTENIINNNGNNETTIN